MSERAPVKSASERIVNMKFELALTQTVFLYAIELEKQIEKAQKQMEEVQRQANIDPVTGLLNRRGFTAALNSPMVSLSRVKRGEQPVNSILMIDIDNFKQANDQHPRGHAGGDDVLRGVADRLRATARKDDVIGRWGGDEMAMFLPETSEAGALRLGKKIVTAVNSSPIEDMAITLSVGAAEFPLGDSLIGQHNADLAAYAAKNAGKNQAIAFSSLE